MILEQIKDWEEEIDSTEEEAISSAALEYEGELFTAHSHAEALLKLEEAKPAYDIEKVQDGFITSTRRFVDRDEAFLIAKKTGQVSQNRLRRKDTSLDSQQVNWFER